MKNEIEANDYGHYSHYRRSGGLHRRGRAFILWQVPYAQRSLLCRGKDLFRA